MENVNPAPRKMFAVVVNGVIANGGEIVQLKGDGPERFPVPLFMHESREKCEQRKASIKRRIDQIRFYDSPNCATSQPILGVVAVTLPAPKVKAPMSDAQKAAMQAGRKKTEVDKKSTVPLVPSVAGKK